MTEWMINLINQFGFWAILFLIALENIFPPIPSEVILSFGGFLTLHTKIALWEIVLASTIGSVLGALILYYVGSLFTEARLKKLVNNKFIKILGFKEDDVSKTIAWFNKHGKGAIFYGRFVPIIRSLISIPAGIAQVKLSLFVSLTFLGSLIWNTVLASLGFYCGSKWDIVVKIIDDYAILCAGLLVIAFGIACIYWYKKRIKARN
jgi:membrane protein DedA with SNARE-associated domain